MGCSKRGLQQVQIPDVWLAVISHHVLWAWSLVGLSAIQLVMLGDGYVLLLKNASNVHACIEGMPNGDNIRR